MITSHGMPLSGKCYKLQWLVDPLGRAYRWMAPVRAWLARVRGQAGQTPMQC